MPRSKALNTNFIPDVKVLGSICAGLLTIDIQSEIVRLVHYTTQEYFERTNAESNIAITCITYLSFDTFAIGVFLIDGGFMGVLQSYPLYKYVVQRGCVIRTV